MHDLDGIEFQTKRKPRGESPAVPRQHLLSKPDDCAAACRDRASADSERARDATTTHSRAMYERSAERWASRAELLQRLETSFDARRAAGIVHRVSL